ncbi:MarR family winged helix-turn-helix transcriptional regulator [Roseobacter sp. N2S]|uniref:MarR family winged helix-turn-helix transcriptional regulator n=1 Tax=Roseobacter sp. N2S TaxID=2663844 RepID=UPI0028605847|nr:MarR family winged helix-turn-helix transcriptional regulator [Roseobacter sp. N2S]MDR6267194.1 DNA-binding MarR family transcriptional regulator [Roseobacter sp. N2S]
MSQFSLDDFLPYQLAVVSSRVSREFSEIYAEHFDMTVPEWRVIVHLYNAGPVSIREIQARVDMDKSKVSRAASRLEKTGFITKETNTDDRRLLKLALTPEGQKRMQQIIPLANAFESKLVERLGPDVDQFRTTLLNLLKETP